MSDLYGVYEKIMHDEEWYEWMKQINEISKTGEYQAMYFDHGMRHAMRTAEYAVGFLDECYRYFECNMTMFNSMGCEEDCYLTAIASLLHDIGIVGGREKHAKRSQTMARKYLKKYKMSDVERKVVVDAIGRHGGEKEITNLIDSAVMMGDKMDVTRARSLAFYDEALMPKLSPVQKELMDLKSVNFYFNYEYQHGVLEWGLVKKSLDDESFTCAAMKMMDTVMVEWPKCITVPQRVVNEFLGVEFSFVVDDLS